MAWRNKLENFKEMICGRQRVAKRCPSSKDIQQLTNINIRVTSVNDMLLHSSYILEALELLLEYWSYASETPSYLPIGLDASFLILLENYLQDIQVSVKYISVTSQIVFGNFDNGLSDHGKVVLLLANQGVIRALEKWKQLRILTLRLIFSSRQ
jgi:hypothetical protein